MGVISTYKAPKGNAGMTLFGTRNDDSTVQLPDIGFDFMYNGVNARAAIYTSGNTWVGFGSSTEHLDINRRDASYNNLYWIKETENGRPVFRIRFEGQGSYSNWGANDLVWELTLYNDSAMVLVMVATPKTGTDSFNTQGPSGTVSCNFQVGKSYVFLPTQSGGKAYTVQEGSYAQVLQKFLIDDGTNGIKGWNGSTWTKVSDGPITEELFRAYGNDSLQSSRSGITLTNPTLCVWTDDVNANMSLKQTACPTPKLLKMLSDWNIPTGIKSATATANTSGSAVVKILVSVDSGVTWKAWNGSTWATVDTASLATVEANAMTANVFTGLTTAQWDALIGTIKIIRLAVYLKQTATSESCSIDDIRINYK